MTINEMNSKMTIFYRKANGEIKQFATGIQGFEMFGEEQEDYKLIWNIIILDRDEYVLKNIKDFIIKDNILMLKEAIKYPVATGGEDNVN